jgi:phosphopantothenoylcysteine synthetase/decarboxylase
MASFEPLPDGTTTGTSCLVVTAGIGMVDTIDRIQAELDTGWNVQVVATPLAAEWMTAGGFDDQIKALTGELPVATFRNPWDTKPATMANRCIAAPVTLNTLTKWAAGNADNLALSMLCEATWTPGIPVVAYITLNGAYRRHPAGQPAIDVLVKAGVQVEPFEAGEATLSVLAATYRPDQLPPNLRAG